MIEIWNCLTDQQKEIIPEFINFYKNHGCYVTNEDKIKALNWFNILFNRVETNYSCRNIMLSVETQLMNFYLNKCKK